MRSSAPSGLRIFRCFFALSFFAWLGDVVGRGKGLCGVVNGLVG